MCRVKRVFSAPDQALRALPPSLRAPAIADRAGAGALPTDRGDLSVSDQALRRSVAGALPTDRAIARTLYWCVSASVAVDGVASRHRRGGCVKVWALACKSVKVHTMQNRL